jgi:hypothetical protein
MAKQGRKKVLLTFPPQNGVEKDDVAQDVGQIAPQSLINY